MDETVGLVTDFPAVEGAPEAKAARCLSETIRREFDAVKNEPIPERLTQLVQQLRRLEAAGAGSGT